jgi:hypothetical protein
LPNSLGFDGVGTSNALTGAGFEPTYHVVTQSEEGARGPTDVAALHEGGQTSEPDAQAAPKERVLHTRVPAVLERELKRFAENLRVPVSNLVRTILEDALSVADAATESVEERLKRAAKHLEREREKLRKRMEHDPLDGLLAFQEVTLAMPATCAKCSQELPRGARAHLGISDVSDGPRVFVCTSCHAKA